MWQAIKNIYHYFQGILAVLWFQFPSRGLFIIGVTGTDGKTTTASMIYHALKVSGKRVALITSIGANINGEKTDLAYHVTTPNAFLLQSYLRKAKNKKVSYVVLEVTSHALDQNRAFGIKFSLGILTNISREHLDYHKTYTRYVSAKAKLLKNSEVCIVNKDDKSFKYIERFIKNKKVITYGFKKDADVNPHLFHFTTKLLGKFNQYNCLAAISAVMQLHIPDDEIRLGISSFKPPTGRQEIIYNKGFMVIIDFAHTPNALLNILSEIRTHTKNRLIHVFGSAGRRDAFKRPEMGKISSEYADVVIITAEDPRTEKVENINHEIILGITDQTFAILNYKRFKSKIIKLKDDMKYIFPIPDRKEAIRFAITLAQNGDVVLLSGKGHEKSLAIGKVETPWNEEEVAKDALRARHLLDV